MNWELSDDERTALGPTTGCIDPDMSNEELQQAIDAANASYRGVSPMSVVAEMWRYHLAALLRIQLQRAGGAERIDVTTVISGAKR